MAVVTNTVTLPNGDPAPNAVVQVRLIASTSGVAPGYEDDRTILGIERVDVTNGVWSVDLEPNANITPANTYYEIIESAAGHAVAHTIRVTTGGPHWLGDLLIAPPDSIPASQLDLHAAEEEAARNAALSGKVDVAEVGVSVAPLEDDGEDGLRVPAIYLPDSATNVVWVETEEEADALPAGTLALILTPIVEESVPGAPTGVLAVAGDGQATVSWTAPADPGSSAISGYTVTSSPGGISVGASASPTVVTGLTNGVAYTFTVTATNDTGTSTASAPSDAVTPNAAAFNPLTQVTALHAFWAEDAAWTAPADGAAVDSVRNQSGGGNPASAGTARPLYRASVAALNNKPALDFDGSDDLVQFNIADVAAPYKRVTVFALKATTVSKNVLGTGAGTGGGFGPNGSGLWAMSTATTFLASAVAVDTTKHIFRGDYGSSGVLRIDETSIATGSAGTSAMSWWIIGAGGSGVTPTRWANCYVAFDAIYDGATSDAALAALCQNLATHYAITLP